MCWLYPANIGTAILNRWLTTVLIDSGACMNCVTLEFMKARGLVVGSIQDLNITLGAFRLMERGGEAYQVPGLRDDLSADTASPEL